MYNINLELIVRIYRQFLGLKTFTFQWHFLPNKTKLLIIDNNYVASFSFFTLNENIGYYEVPLELISIISSLGIRTVIDETLVIQNDEVVINNVRYSLVPLEKQSYLSYLEQDDGCLLTTENILPALIDSQSFNFGKRSELYISNFYTIQPNEDHTSISYLRHNEDTRDLNFYTSNAKFFYCLLSRLKIKPEVFLACTSDFYFLNCGLDIKLADKSLVSITIDISFPYAIFDFDRWNLYLNLYNNCLDMKELHLSYEKLENKISQIKEDELKDNELIPFAKNKKFLVKDYLRIFKYGKELTSLHIYDNLVLFRFNQLDVLYTLHTLVENL